LENKCNEFEVIVVGAGHAGIEACPAGISDPGWRGAGDPDRGADSPLAGRAGASVVRDQIHIRPFEKRGDCRGFVSLILRPRADTRQGWQNGWIWRQKETGTPCLRPLSERIIARPKFVPNFFYAVHATRGILGYEPVSESRTDVKAVVTVLRLDEHVRIEEIRHQSCIPNRRPSS
jgi:hypothetical protein